MTSWVSWQLAEHHDRSNDWTDRLGTRIPLPMILRDLGVGIGGTWESLLEKFVSTPPGHLLTMANLKQILRDGEAMIILDGLDEIGNPQVRRELKEAVWGAFTDLDRCRWLLTSRVVGYDEVRFHEDAATVETTPEFLKGDAGFSRAELSVKRAELAYVTPFDDPKVDRFAENWFVLRESADHTARKQAEALLEAVRSNEATTKLGRIPNLLTMMALIFRVRARLPHGRALLYGEIADAYLESIDEWRKILTRTETLAERRRWLSRIGFEMQRKRVSEGDEDAEILASGDEVRMWTAAAMGSDLETSADDAAEFVDYLARRSGLLLPRGQDQFAFLHLSFQEYFAGVYLQNQIASPDWMMETDQVADGTSKKDLHDYGTLSVWRETLVFLAELVAASDQTGWLKPILSELFGDDFSGIGFSGIGVDPEDPSDQNRALLLARLTINPHSELATEKRERAINVICCRELQVMGRLAKEDELWQYKTEVLRILFDGEPEVRAGILPAIVAQAKHLDTTHLDLRETGVSDVSSLSDLTSLNFLNLGGTGVSDVSSLSGLSSLRRLYLRETGVGDVSSLSRLSLLWRLSLYGTGVSDNAVDEFQRTREAAGLRRCGILR